MNAMNCVEVANVLDQHVESRLTAARRASVDAHLARCDSCESAWEALQALRAERATPVPAPRADLFDQAMQLVAARAAPRRPAHRQRPFWLGAVLGGALAASVVLALLSVGPAFVEVPAGGTPELLMALNETRDVNIAIDSPVDVGQAEIRVLLSGAIALAGFEGQSELHWATPLDRGVNMLKLPVAMQGRGGGYLLVEVSYGTQRKTFAVHLQEGPASGEDSSVYAPSMLKRAIDQA